MSETNNNTPMRITQLEEATAYEDGMFYAVAKAGSGTKKIRTSVLPQAVQNYSLAKGYYQINGKFTANPGWRSIIDFIKVSDVSAINMKLYSGCGGVCYYDSNYIFISCQTTTSSSGEQITSLTIPTGAIYVRFSYFATDSFSLTLSGDDMFVNAKNNLNNAIKSFTDISVANRHTNGNIYSSSLVTWENGKYISGPTINYLNVLKLSDYIPISEYTKIHIKFNYNGTNQSVKGSFFDAEKNYISMMGSENEYEIPPNAYYVRINGLSSDEQTCSEGNYVFFTSKFIANGSSYISKWNGHTINALGDSITYGYGLPDREAQRWTTLLSEKTGATVRNYGVSSSKISDITGDTTPSFVDRVSSLPTADLNIIFGGTNDYWHMLTDIGNVDSSDVSTFCGALNYVLNYFQTNNPTGRLVFVFPMHQKFNGNTDFVNFGHGTFDDFRKAAINVCSRNGVPILDLYSDSGISSMVNAQMTAYTSDGVHLNVEGQQLACDLIYQMIEFGIV